MEQQLPVALGVKLQQPAVALGVELRPPAVASSIFFFNVFISCGGECSLCMEYGGGICVGWVTCCLSGYVHVHAWCTHVQRPEVNV